MAVLPTVSTRRENPPLSYEEYLQSASWRITRNRALMRADPAANAATPGATFKSTIGRTSDSAMNGIRNSKSCATLPRRPHAIAEGEARRPVRLLPCSLEYARYDRRAPTTYGDRRKR